MFVFQLELCLPACTVLVVERVTDTLVIHSADVDPRSPLMALLRDAALDASWPADVPSLRVDTTG